MVMTNGRQRILTAIRCAALFLLFAASGCERGVASDAAPDVAAPGKARSPRATTAVILTEIDGITTIPAVMVYLGDGAHGVYSSRSDSAAKTVLTAAIPTGIIHLAHNAATKEITWTFTTEMPVVAQIPAANFPTPAEPADTAAETTVNQKRHATFSEVADPSTNSTATFTLRPGAIPDSGVNSHAGITIAPGCGRAGPLLVARGAFYDTRTRD